MPDIIEPRVLKGFRDYLPDAEQARLAPRCRGVLEDMTFEQLGRESVGRRSSLGGCRCELASQLVGNADGRHGVNRTSALPPCPSGLAIPLAIHGASRGRFR